MINKLDFYPNRHFADTVCENENDWQQLDKVYNLYCFQKIKKR